MAMRPKRTKKVVDLNHFSVFSGTIGCLNEWTFYKEYESGLVIMIQRSSTIVAIGIEGVML